MSRYTFIEKRAPYLYSCIRMLLYRLRTNFRIEKEFGEIWRNNAWGDSESISGTGSNLYETVVLREKLPYIFEKYNIRTLIDVPCGDMCWMSEINSLLDGYIGIDIVPQLIKGNTKEHGGKNVAFQCADITKDLLPDGDAIFCRDCLVHLSYCDIKKALTNIKQGGAKYLLTTTFIRSLENHDIYTGAWRPINLERPPFNFPSPLEIIVEDCTEYHGKYSDKAIGVWRIADLP